MRQQKAPTAQAVSSRLSAPRSRSTAARYITSVALSPMATSRSPLTPPAVRDGRSGSPTGAPYADDSLSRQSIGGRAPASRRPATDRYLDAPEGADGAACRDARRAARRGFTKTSSTMAAIDSTRPTPPPTAVTGVGWLVRPRKFDRASMIRHVIATQNAHRSPRATPAALIRVATATTPTTTMAGTGGVPLVWWLAAIMNGIATRSRTPRMTSRIVVSL